MEDDHIHFVGDGRPYRTVYCDGEKIAKAIYADTKIGYVKFYGDTVEIDASGEAPVTFEKYGEIEIIFHDPIDGVSAK
jgi:hypothetical protein